MADLSSWFKRLTPLGGQGSEGAVQGAVDVLAEVGKAQESQKQVASADVATQQKAKT